MAGKRTPGPTCVTKGHEVIDSGTLCRQPSPTPGPVGVEPTSWFDSITSYISGQAKSMALTFIDLIPLKPDSPYSTALLKHYVEGSGEPYELEDIPKDWQDWIVKTTRGRIGVHRELNPYNSGIYDLRNSLGHFNVTITKNKYGTRTFTITDTYEFGYKKNDRNQRGRHGFPLGQLDNSMGNKLQKLLPSTKYWNPGGFKERWEIKNVGKDTILYIPQQFLAEQGKKYSIKGSFTR